MYVKFVRSFLWVFDHSVDSSSYILFSDIWIKAKFQNGSTQRTCHTCSKLPINTVD